MDPTHDFDAAHTYSGTAFRRRLPIPPSLLSWLSLRAASQPDSPFITFVETNGGESTLSYGELDRLSRRLAGWLARRTGAGPGHVVAVAAANDRSSVLAIFATLRTGAAILFVNSDDPPARIRQQCEALDTLCLLHGPGVNVPRWPGVLPLPDVSKLPEAEDLWPSPDPFAEALFFGTSGSTAVSKLVAQSHYNAAVNAEAIRRHHGLGPDDRFLGCLPIHHVNGLHFTIFGTLAAGTHAILAPGFEPFGYAGLIEKYRVRVASVVPSILDSLLATWRGASLPPEFDYFVSAAAPLSCQTARAVADRLGRRILQGYGLTETVNFAATMPRYLSDDAYARLMTDADTPSIGIALLGNEMAVLQPDLEPARPGETGEICIRGHNVMMRYAGNEAATRESFRGGWFHSQDLGVEVLDEGRRFFVIKGRLKNIAKIGGRAVSLEEMDGALRKLPHIVDAACVALPDPLLGERIVAVVVLSAPVEDCALREGLAQVFATAVLPARFERMAVLPRTPTGKILRARLAEQLSAAGTAAGD